MTVPEPVLAALDRLNGHARAHGCGRRAIYSYKTMAALALARAGEMTVRSVKVAADCLSCGGTGLWRDCLGDGLVRHANCRKCARTGKVTLRFVETTSGPRVWHHPAVGPGYDILRAAWRIKDWRFADDGRDIAILDDGTEREQVWEPAGDWQPNRPGERLEGEAAAALLNIVEDWVVEVSPAILPSPWMKESALCEMRDYSLRLPRDGAERCCKCGEAVG